MYLYDDSDVLKFAPTSLGEQTEGTITRYLCGSTVGLTTPEEDIDALAIAADGRLLLSTIGQADVKGGPFADEDLFAYEPDEGFSLYLDGTQVQAGDLVAASLDADDEERPIYLALENGPVGDGADILRYVPGGIGAIPLFWNGSVHGMGTSPIDGIFLGNGPFITDCGGIVNCSFEIGFDYWDVQPGNPDFESWTLSSANAHTGQFSALAEAPYPDGGLPSAILQSPLISIEPTNTEYRFSLYAKFVENGGGSYEINSRIDWFVGTNYVSSTPITTLYFGFEDWELQGSQFVCPPEGANTAQIVFEIMDDNLAGANSNSTESNQTFIDDVKIESQPGTCPLLNQ
ncbi:MAG: hypothetical protein H6662_06445 [Ardenticatenaceae bacterium]|nr:hypothetical protein [Anaerolineales bacterium]MCB8921204.1 hypothetical protein [Ardenticatenaceae bacterium]MCB8992169.1 hypothetical protein [Ardenticatenaceae bacterium]MCB9004276.1 hypothetical protein [Ardenticatenaceae bacterium]